MFLIRPLPVEKAKPVRHITDSAQESFNKELRVKILFGRTSGGSLELNLPK